MRHNCASRNKVRTLSPLPGLASMMAMMSMGMLTIIFLLIASKVPGDAKCKGVTESSSFERLLKKFLEETLFVR